MFEFVNATFKVFCSLDLTHKLIVSQVSFHMREFNLVRLCLFNIAQSCLFYLIV